MTILRAGLHVEHSLPKSDRRADHLVHSGAKTCVQPTRLVGLCVQRRLVVPKGFADQVQQMKTNPQNEGSPTSLTAFRHCSVCDYVGTNGAFGPLIMLLAKHTQYPPTPLPVPPCFFFFHPRSRTERKRRTISTKVRTV